MPQIIRLSLEQKLRFILAVQNSGAVFAHVCRVWHISRKTGYHWWRRYRHGGLEALQEQSRAPRRRPHALPELWREAIENIRRHPPIRGPQKLERPVPPRQRRSRGAAAHRHIAALHRLG